MSAQVRGDLRKDGMRGDLRKDGIRGDLRKDEVRDDFRKVERDGQSECCRDRVGLDIFCYGEVCRWF